MDGKGRDTKSMKEWWLFDPVFPGKNCEEFYVCRPGGNRPYKIGPFPLSEAVSLAHRLNRATAEILAEEKRLEKHEAPRPDPAVPVDSGRHDNPADD
jgi:hypothetical protein